MITALIASTLFAGNGTCHVPIVQRVVAHQAVHQVNYGHAAAVVNYGHHQTYTPYYTASALAYKVEDTEKTTLLRVVEKQADALIDRANKAEARADRNEAALLKGGDGQGSPAEIPKLSAEAKSIAPAILKAACAKCHSGDKAQGGFALSLLPDGKASLEMRSLIFDVVSQGEMPPKSAKPLTEDEKKAIGEWAAASREELKAAVKSAKK
jgi:mono/diheme cytochrome c family protein